jgi:hypothetical protein
VGEEGPVVDHVEHRVGCRGDDRPARERGAVVAGLEHVPVLGRGHAGADRQAAAHALGHGHHVRCQPVLLPRPQRARATHAALDLVEDQQRAVRVAELSRRGEQLRIDRVDARFALNRLDDHCRGALVDGEWSVP